MESRKLSRIGVVGAGVMGRGVAQAVAQCNMDVVLMDVSEEALASAMKEIHQAVRFSSMMTKGAASFDPDEVCARIEATTELAKLSDLDFLVENVTEKVDIKEPLYAELDKVCRADCVIAVNTSAISIARVGSWTNRADRIVGMHFMNPVPMKPLVEVIRSRDTAEETVETALAFLAAMDKKGVVVNDMPGFVSNRVLMLTVNEAIFVVQDEVASAKDVDRIFKGCFGHKMGPLETADLIGLDTILYSLEVLHESYNDDKFRPCQLLVTMVNDGLYGRKNGQGFYKYPTL